MLKGIPILKSLKIISDSSACFNMQTASISKLSVMDIFIYIKTTEFI